MNFLKRRNDPPPDPVPIRSRGAQDGRVNNPVPSPAAGGRGGGGGALHLLPHDLGTGVQQLRPQVRRPAAAGHHGGLHQPDGALSAQRKSAWS